MKKVLYIFMIVSIFFSSVFIANAVDCAPKFRWDYIVEGSCTWPGNYKVFWDIIVGDKIITVPNGRIIGIDLMSKKATFTLGKILFLGSWKMTNTNSSGYYIAINYWAGGTTNCPAGYSLLTMAINGYYVWGVLTRPSSGTFYCWK